jgi:hypothetical protein
MADHHHALLTAALAYAARGWRVFPCHTPTAQGCSCWQADCTNIGKHPRTPNGCKDATTAEAQIRAWWAMWPQANIGVATGSVSGFVALDVDIGGEKRGDLTLEALEHSYAPLPDTVEQHTGSGGRHRLFLAPETPIGNSASKVGPHLDIRGDGGYIIVPPSLHASGQRYVWEQTSAPEDIPLAPLPDWLLALCQSTPRPDTPDAGAPIPEGIRNDTLFRIGCGLRAKGLTEAVILAALQEMNTTQCQPPLGAEQVHKIAASCATYQPGRSPGDPERRRNGAAAHAPEAEAPPAHAVVVSMEDIEECAIAWLWEPYVAIGKLCLLDGDPGTGKTGFASMLAAAVSRGDPMPDQQGKPTVPTGAPGTVLIVAAEDDLADTFKRRLRLCGADMSKINVLNDIVTAQGRQQHFTLEHLALLEEEVQRYRPRLVYVDSLQAILGGKVDINRANQVTDVLIGLQDLAAKYRFALIATRHPAKPGQNLGRLIHRGMGSQAFIGRARLALYVEEHPLDPTKSLLVQSKSNAGVCGVTQIFSKAGGHFEWCGTTRITAQVMAGSGRGPDPYAFIEACFWLEDQLSDGCPRKAEDLIERAKEYGLSNNAL